MNKKESFVATFIRIHLQNMHHGKINPIIFLIGYLIATLQLIQKLGLKQDYLMKILSYSTLQTYIGKQSVLILGICLIGIFEFLRILIYIQTYKSFSHSQKKPMIRLFKTGFVRYLGFFIQTIFYIPVITACLDILKTENKDGSAFQALALIAVLLYSFSFIISKILDSRQNFIIQANSGQNTLQTINPLLIFDCFRIIYVLVSQNIIIQIGSLVLYSIITVYSMYKWPIISYKLNIYRQILIVVADVFCLYKVIQFAGQFDKLSPIFLVIIVVITIFGLIVLIKKRQKIIIQNQENFVQKLKYLFYQVINEKAQKVKDNNNLALFIINHKKLCQLQTCNCSKIIKFYIQKDQKVNQSYENCLKLQTYWYQFIVNQIRYKHQINENKKIVLSQLIIQMSTLEESMIFCSEILSFKLNKTNQAFLLLENMMIVLRNKQIQEGIFQGKCNFLISLMSQNNIKNLQKSEQSNEYCREYFEFHACNQKILTSINEAKCSAIKFWNQMKYYDPDEEKLLNYLRKLDSQDFKIQKNYQRIKNISKTNAIEVDQQIQFYEKKVFNIQRKSLSMVQQVQIEPLNKKQNYQMNISKQANLFFDTSNTGICTHSLNNQNFGLIFSKNTIFKNLFQKSFSITKINDLIIKQMQQEHDKTIQQFTIQQKINYSHDYSYLKVNKRCIKKFKIFSQIIPSLDEGLKIASFFNCQIYNHQHAKVPILGINEHFQVLYANSEVLQNILQTQIYQQNLKQKNIQIKRKQQIQSENNIPIIQSVELKDKIPKLNIRICENYYSIAQFKIVGKKNKLIFIQMQNFEQLSNSKIQEEVIRELQQKRALNLVFGLNSKTKSLKLKTNFFNSEIFRQIVKKQQNQEIIEKVNKLQKVYQTSVKRNDQKIKKNLLLFFTIFFFFALASSILLIVYVNIQSELFNQNRLILDETKLICSQIGKGLTTLREINVNSYLGTNSQYISFMYQELFRSKEVVRHNMEILSRFYIGDMITVKQILPSSKINVYLAQKYIAISNFIVSRFTTLYYEGQGTLNFSPMQSQLSIPYSSIQSNFLESNINGVFTILPSLFNETTIVYQTQIISSIESFQNKIVIIPFLIIIVLFIISFVVVIKFQAHDTKVIKFAFSFIQDLKVQNISSRLKLLNDLNNQNYNQNGQALKQCQNQSLFISKMEIMHGQQLTSERSNTITYNMVNSNLEEQNDDFKIQTQKSDNICQNRRKMKFKVQNWWTKIGGAIFFFMIPFTYLVFAISDIYIINKSILEWYSFQAKLLQSQQITQFGYLYLLQMGPLQIPMPLANLIIKKIDQFYLTYRTLRQIQKQILDPSTKYFTILKSIQYENVCQQIFQFKKSQTYGLNFTKNQCQSLSNSVLTLGIRSALNFYLQSSRQIAYKNQKTYKYTHQQRVEYMESPELQEIRKLSGYINQFNNLLKNAFYQDFQNHINSYKSSRITIALVFLAVFMLFGYLYIMRHVLSQKIKKQFVIRSIMKLISFQSLLKNDKYKEQAGKGDDMFKLS